MSVAHMVAGVTADELLRAYDDQLRAEGELTGATDVERHGPLLWGQFPGRGFVTYRDLGGVAGEDLDRLIADTVAHYRDDTSYASFEWKSRGHDQPADLGDRLIAGGLVAEEVETVMVGETAGLVAHVELPAGVVVRRAGDGHDLADDVTRMLAMQQSVFGPGRGPRAEDVLADLADRDEEYWLAEVDGTAISAGRLSPVPGTRFAGLWGGSTLPEWRGRGVYRALTAARARSALARGTAYLHSDCTEMSRPILERSGLVAVTTTTPYVWHRSRPSG